MDVEMKVSGLTGNHNDKVLKDVVHAIDGVHHVELHAADGIVKIRYDQEEVSLKSICDVIEYQGYKVDR